MAASSEPRSGLVYGWAYGENGWNTGMDANLLRLGRFGFHLSAKSRAVTAPPASPASGDTYLVPAGATGAWAGHADALAVWVPGTPAGAWQYGTPRAGWQVVIEDEAKMTTYLAGAWTAGITL